ncbi:threonine ammonia-lyase [Alsobacter sp. R-9]
MLHRAPPSHERIAEAHRAIDPVFVNSPQLSNPALDAALGCSLLAKVETLNPIRSFKGRGTDWFVRTDKGTEPLVTASAGNFGQGLARAAVAAGRAIVVFASVNANPLKVAAMRRLGAEVRQVGDDFDEAKAAARLFAEGGGGRLVVDGDEPAIAEGAGTIALEMLRDAPDLECVVVPLGNGALATGIGAWIKAMSPRTQVIAVVASVAPSMKLSFDLGRVVETEDAPTIADGIAVRVPVPYALDTMRGTVDEVLAVDEDVIVGAMRLAHEHLGLVVEPAGASGLAAILADPARFAGRRVGTILCGGNLTPDQIRQWLTP